MNWIREYEPRDAQEAEVQADLLRLPPRLVGTSRDLPYHYTTSAVILDEAKEKLLMIYHPIYQSWSWPGGHVEEGETLFVSALREVYEETGLKYVKPLKESPFGLDLLPVADHVRKGEDVPAHFHVNFAFGFTAKIADTYGLKGESKVFWIKTQELSTFVEEAHMLPYYEKYIQRIRQWEG